MTPTQWKDDFLQSRNLTYQDISTSSIPIYQLHITDEEFTSLKSVLQLSSILGMDNVFKKVKFWDAIFVVYAAEWWRREYDGKSWKWENIFNSFGADVDDLNTLQRNRLVERGVGFWKRELRKVNGSTRYLGTIAIEGGLPLKQLSNSESNGGWLGHVLKQAIPKYMKFKDGGVSAFEIIKEYFHIFPKTFRNEQIYSILGDIVEAVVSLKLEYKLHNETNPVDYLNKNVSGWQERFPLPMSDDTSAKLLSDMISTAVKASESQGLPFTVNRFLNDNYELEMTIDFDRFIELKTIFSNKDEDSIPARLEVVCVSNTSKQTSLGYALKTSFKGKSCLKMPKLKYVVGTQQANLSHSICFKNISNIIKEITLDKASDLDYELPWVFSQKDDLWGLDGVASVSTRAKKVRIIYPANLRFEAENLTIIATVGQRVVAEASGTIRLYNSTDSVFVIKTGQEKSAEQFYLYSNNSFDFFSRPKEVFVGLPVLKCINTESHQSYEISVAQLLCKPVNSSLALAPLCKSNQGVYEVRYCNPDGSIRFRKKCVLLPQDFSIRLKPKRNSLDGYIYLDNVGNAEVICESDINHTIACSKDSIQVEMFPSEAPPAYVSLALRWKGQTETLTLKIPFPVNGGILMSPEDQRIVNKQLYLDNLHGYRIYLFSERPQAKKDFQIDLILKDQRSKNTKDIYYRTKLTQSGALISVPIIDYLDWAKELLSVTKNLDSYVLFSVYQDGALLIEIKIYQYQMSLNRNEMEGCVELAYLDNQQCSYDKLIQTELQAIRLSQPEESPIILSELLSEQTHVGRWGFSPEKRAPEPWLIFPSPESSISFRAILWNGESDATPLTIDEISVSTLHKAVQIQSHNMRNLVVNKVLLQMCFDFKHSGWQYLKNLAQAGAHIPLNTFDVWPLIIANHKMLVATVLQMDEAFIEKLNSELPIFWELITLSDWMGGFYKYQLYLQDLMGEGEEDVKILIEKRIDHLEFLPESMDVVKRALKLALLNITDQELGLMGSSDSLGKYVIPAISSARNDLDRQQANQQWPPVLNNDITRYWKESSETSLSKILDAEKMSGHHLSVTLLPVLLAQFCTTRSPKYWADDFVHIFKLKQLKSFDEDWFNVAFKFSFSYLCQLPESLERLKDWVTKMDGLNDMEIQEIEQKILVLKASSYSEL